jgi:tryptophan halogenase
MAHAAPIQRIVIAGGGTAGWMCAAGLARVVPRDVSVTLVESAEIGTVGVGEATIPTLSDFNEFLGIDEADLLRATGGSIKLGIEFVDWYARGQRYFHPFGTFGMDTAEFKFHHLWLRLALAGAHESVPADLVADISDYNLCSLAARAGKFAQDRSGNNAFVETLRYAFHFDAERYAAMLRAYAEARGVRRVEGRIATVEQSADGRIAALELADGDRIAGDLFVDCTGFRSLLLGETLGAGFIDWSDALPCDRAVTVASPALSPVPPFTRSTADDAGWRWRIPLQHRTGNGYVYCSRYLSDDAARARLLESIDGPALGEPRLIRFRTGHRARFWVGNCVAIGLAAGFIEPLESTSIHLIQMGIARLLRLFPDTGFDPADIAEYDRQMQREFDEIRDFIVLHYMATSRDDTPFWRQCRTLPVSDTLAHRITLFRSKGRLARHQDELFTEESWLAVMLGQGMRPASYDRLVDRYPLDRVVGQTRALRQALAQTVAQMPTHAAFLDRLRSAPA